MKKRTVVCVLLLILICLGVVSWEKVFGPIRGLTDADSKVRQRAVEDLATSWVPNRVTRLTAALKDSAVEVRIAAACARGSIDGEVAIAPLIDALQDADPRMSEAAAAALGKIGQPALEPLIGALEHEDVRVRMGAVSALSLIVHANEDPETRATAARAIIRRAMRDFAVTPFANGALLEMGEAGPGLIIGALEDEDTPVRPVVPPAEDRETRTKTIERLIRVMAERTEIRQMGALALGKIGEPAFEPLLAALQDEDARVRTAAASAMQQVLPAVQDPATRARAIEPLIAVLKEDDKTSISYAFPILVEIGEPALEPLLRSALEQGGRSFSAAAVREMIGAGENAELARKVMERLIHQLKEESNSAAAFALGQVLSDVEDAATVQTAASALIAALKNDVPEVRREAAFALGQMLSDAPDPAMVQAAALSLIAALEDDRSDVRAAAASALGQILGGGEDPQISQKAIESLLTALESDSAIVRLHVAGALGRAVSRVPDPALGRKAVPLLLALLQDPDMKYNQDVEASKTPGLLTRERIVLWPLTGSTVRMTNILQKDLEVIEALGRIIAALKSAELAQTALPPLIEALQDNDASVRSHAAEALGSIFSVVAEPELAQQAVQPLLAALEDKTTGVRDRAAWALVKIGTEEAKDAVRSAGFDPDHPPSPPTRDD